MEVHQKSKWLHNWSSQKHRGFAFDQVGLNSADLLVDEHREFHSPSTQRCCITTEVKGSATLHKLDLLQRVAQFTKVLKVTFQRSISTKKRRCTRVEHSAINSLMAIHILEDHHPSFSSNSHRLHRLRSCGTFHRWIGSRNRALSRHVTSLATSETCLQGSRSTTTGIRLFSRTTRVPVRATAFSFRLAFSSFSFSGTTLLAFDLRHLLRSRRGKSRSEVASTGIWESNDGKVASC